MNTGAGSRITAKVVPCVSTVCACVRPDTTFRRATASVFAEKVQTIRIIYVRRNN